MLIPDSSQPSGVDPTKLPEKKPAKPSPIKIYPNAEMEAKGKAAPLRATPGKMQPRLQDEIKKASEQRDIKLLMETVKNTQQRFHLRDLGLPTRNRVDELRPPLFYPREKLNQQMAKQLKGIFDDVLESLKKELQSLQEQQIMVNPIIKELQQHFFEIVDGSKNINFEELNKFIEALPKFYSPNPILDAIFSKFTDDLKQVAAVPLHKCVSFYECDALVNRLKSWQQFQLDEFSEFIEGVIKKHDKKIDPIVLRDIKNFYGVALDQILNFDDFATEAEAVQSLNYPLTRLNAFLEAAFKSNSKLKPVFDKIRKDLIENQYPLHEAIKAIKKYQYSKENLNVFISKPTLIKLISPQVFNKFENVFKNMSDFISHHQFQPTRLEGNPFINHVLNKLQSRPQIMGPYALKTGVFTKREFLAADSVKILKLQDAVVSKYPMNVTYQNEQQKGALSRWVDEKFPEADWGNYCELRQKYVALMFQVEHAEKEQKPKLMQELEKMKKEYESAAQRVKGVASKHSFQLQGVLDALYQSNDSHSGQYHIEDGRILNVDFADFLYGSDIGQGVTPKERYGLFRSCFLDHPFAMEPLDDQLIKTISQWNVDEIVRAHKEKKLLGSQDQYDKDVETLEELYRRLGIIEKQKESNTPIPEFEALCKKIRIPAEHKSLPQQMEYLENALSNQKNQLLQRWHRLIHPAAFSQFIQRIRLAQEYIKSTEQPTGRGLRDALYPDLKLFFAVLERMEINPSATMEYTEKDGNWFPRDLASIIVKAKELKLVTDDEVKELQATLAKIKTTKAVSLTARTFSGF